MIKSLLFFLLLSTKTLASWGNELPGEYQQGKCMTFATAYADTHPGSRMIVWVHEQYAHIIIYTADGAFVDNLHPSPIRQPRGLNVWASNNGYDINGWSIMTVIDYDHQSDQDRAVIAWLKQHER